MGNSRYSQPRIEKGNSSPFFKEKIVIRKLGVFLLTIVAASIVGLAQPQSLLTRHLLEVTVNGQAASVGRLAATQSLRIDIVLPAREGWTASCTSSMILPAPPAGTF
jgi:hypothetical protein